MSVREKLIEILRVPIYPHLDADPAEVVADYLIDNGVTVQKHGRWEQCFEDWRQQIEGDKCSVCGFEHYGCGMKDYHYCPNCGAIMECE